MNSMKQVALFCLLLATILLAACTSRHSSTATPTDIAVEPAAVAEQTQTSARSTPSPAASPRSTESESEAAAATSLPAGLYFTTFEPAAGGLSQGVTRLWLVDATGQPREQYKVEDGLAKDFTLTPDGSQALYSLQDDIWLVDFSSNRARNLTNTSDRWEGRAMWWPGRPGYILCGSIPADSPELWIDGSFGYLTIIGPDDSPTITHDFLYAAPQPLDGRLFYERVRVGPEGHPSLMDNEQVTRQPDGTIENFENPEPAGILWIEDISAAPDGEQIGFSAMMQPADNAPPQTIIFMLDQRMGSYQILDQYEPMGLGGSMLNSAPAWNPSGDVIAYYKLAWPAEESGVWIRDNAGTRLVTTPDSEVWGNGPPVFSPNGQWIAAHVPGGQLGIIDTAKWRVYTWDTEYPLIGIGWIDPGETTLSSHENTQRNSP